jgi:dipeptidyl aminopeptidase/acylaminoacyl peptidase
MALFQYFPGNYIWNLAVNMAIESGARLGEIEDMCRPLLAAAARGEDAGTGEFLRQWVSMADKLVTLAEEDETLGRLLSAGAKLQRAALYYLVAERMQGRGHPLREETYARAQQAFRKGTACSRENAERVEIPYAGKLLPALLTRPRQLQQRVPGVLYVNGLDSCKELLYWTWLPQALARRGIATLSVDQPGTGESLRLLGLPATHESERWATACYDWLADVDGIDAERIGMIGISLGGYFTPRAMAFEPRFASGAVWGANHNWFEVQQQRLKREGENPVPHYWEHVCWVFGAADIDDFMARATGMHLNGILGNIKVPFLVTHGAHDRQIAVYYARQTYDQLVNSQRRELRIFTEREGGVEHVGADNMSFARDYIADWFAETLGGSTTGTTGE